MRNSDILCDFYNSTTAISASDAGEQAISMFCFQQFTSTHHQTWEMLKHGGIAFIHKRRKELIIKKNNQSSAFVIFKGVLPKPGLHCLCFIDESQNSISVFVKFHRIVYFSLSIVGPEIMPDSFFFYPWSLKLQGAQYVRS